MDFKLDIGSLVTSEYERVVAAEPRDNGTAIIFVRKGDRVEKKEIPFNPFLLLADPLLLNGCNSDFEIKKLEGAAIFAYVAKFADVSTCQHAIKHLKTTTRISPSSPNAPYRIFNDLSQQLFTSERFRLFRGMTFDEISRLQFDIETLTTQGYEFPNPKREGDKISLISMCNNDGWEECLILNDPFSEKELLQKFVEIIKDQDPDVIEGHNIFRFDLPFIEERAKRHKVALSLGRDESLLKSRPSRISIAERTISYPRYEVYGRHIVDTYHLVQFYDVTHRDLEDYSLKSVARHFGVASADRTYVEGAEISGLFSKDRKRLINYAKDDVRETRAVADILSPSYFYQAQLVPFSYQSCVVRGNAARIEAMLIAAYLNRNSSIPAPEFNRSFSGALTEALESGIFKNVWHCDVRSLYPSIILSEKWCPSRDYLGIFPFFLDKLRSFRLAAKDAGKASKPAGEKDICNALQTTFKILINSFYGYLGFSQGTFNDYNMAESVTSKGRQILTAMLNFLKASGANVIEMDTDGMYFQPPQDISNPLEMEKKIQKILPKGIEVELDGTYPSMFCYKSKNYALLKEDGEIAITGAALKSRGLEPFQREYMRKFIAFLLESNFPAIEKMTEEYRTAIKERKWPLAKLAKTEILQDSPDSYRRKQTDGEERRSAAYALAIKSGRDYRQGDQVSFYVTGEKKKVSVVDNSRLLADAPAERDENVAYYLEKLEELYKKFSQFLPADRIKEEKDGLGI